MRFFGLFTALTVATAASAAILQPARPRAASAPISRAQLRQVQTKELIAKAKYPEFFTHQKRQSNGANPNCSGRRKRGVIAESWEADDLQVLSPRQVAEFLINRGAFTHTNGTTLVDRDFIEDLQQSENRNAKRSKVSRAVYDYFSDSLVNLGMPMYKHWKQRSLTGMDATFHLSKNIAFQVRDIPHIERALLDDPNFTETHVVGYRVTRRLIEAANFIG